MSKYRNRGSVAAHLGVPKGGVRLGSISDDLSGTQSPMLKNVIFKNNMLRRRFGCETVVEDIGAGEIHAISSSEFFGHTAVHIGDRLIMLSHTGECETVCTGLPDKDSLMFEMNRRLYVFLPDFRIISVDDSLTAREEELPSRVVYTGATYYLSDEYEVSEVSDNILAMQIEVHYIGHDINIPHLVLPIKCDTSLPITVVGEETGNTYPISHFTVTDERLTVKPEYSLCENCTVKYFPKKGDELRDFDKIFGCRVCECYGGSSAGGTRVFFAGNPEFCGYYFMSELLSPLVVKSDSYDIIGNGSEDIVALAKQRDELCAFCKSAVFGIDYNFSQSTGADFRVHLISRSVGCDMPGSIQLADNRLVFASSQGGIYIIVSSDYTDELSVRKISANIEGKGTENGFFGEEAMHLTAAVSCDFDRKYMLFVGNTVYVWDYGSSPYYAGAKPDDAERSLCWYVFSDICEKAVFVCGNCLFALCEADTADGGDDNEDDNEGENGEGAEDDNEGDNDGDVENGSGNGQNTGEGGSDSHVRLIRFDDGIESDLGEDIHCVYRTRDVDIDAPTELKILKSISFEVPASEGGVSHIDVYGDDALIYSTDISTSEESRGVGTAYCPNGIRRVELRVPEFRCGRFSFELSSRKGRFGIANPIMSFSFRF